MELSSAVIEANGDFVSIIPTVSYIKKKCYYKEIYFKSAPLMNGSSRMESLNKLFEACSFMSSVPSEASKVVIDKWRQLRLCMLTSDIGE